MADKVYPQAAPAAAAAAAKPTPTAAAATTTANPNFPANKAQLYNANRHNYKPAPPPPRRRRRSCCCSCCLWTTLFVILVIILAAVAGGVVWVLYRPHQPTFSVSSLQISELNLTSSDQLTSKLNLTVSAKNPNKKITFFYDPIAVTVRSDGVDIGDGSFPGFTHGTKNTTSLQTTLSVSGESVDSSSGLVSGLKSKNGLPLQIQLDTRVKVKMGKLKSKGIRIRVKCDGVNAAVPGKNSTTTTTTSKAKCKVDVRFKIWKWTV